MPDSSNILLSGALLDRYLAGEATPAEVAEVRAWLAVHPDGTTLLARAAAVSVTQHPPATSHEREALWQRIGDATRTRSAPIARRVVGRIIARRSAGLFASAALAALLIVVGLVGMWERMAPPKPASYAMTSTTSGQITRLTLDDGTRVTLAPNSVLGVSRDFTTSRDVTLTGEAYFDVASARHAPFIVHTGSVNVRVLGTAFDVKRYAADRDTRIIVVSGKVAAGAPRRSSVTLVAGAMGHINDSAAVIGTVDDVSAATGWTSGRLRFRGTPVAEVLAQLSQWYGIEFRLSDSTLNHETVTAALDYRETTDVVRALENLLDVTATSKDTTTNRPIVVLHPRRSASQTHTVPRRWTPQLTEREVGR